MKRKVASRRLKRRCISCGVGFKKGDVYYKERNVFTDWIAGENTVIAWEYLTCSRCKWREDNHNKRFKKFQKACEHPEKWIMSRYVHDPTYGRMDFEEFCWLCGGAIDGIARRRASEADNFIRV